MALTHEDSYVHDTTMVYRMAECVSSVDAEMDDDMDDDDMDIDMHERRSSIDPVIELTGEISEVEIFEVEDLDDGSTIMQCPESSMYDDYDADDSGRHAMIFKAHTGAGASVSALPLWLAKAHADDAAKAIKPTTPADKKRKQRYYALGITLAMVVAGCGYLTASGEFDPSSKNAAKAHDKQSAFANHDGAAYTIDRSSSGSGRSDSDNDSDAGVTNNSHSAVHRSTQPSNAAVLTSGLVFHINLANTSLCLDIAVATSATAMSAALLTTQRQQQQRLLPPSPDRTLAFATCIRNRTSQLFVYDPLNYFVTSAAYAGWCLDSGSSSSSSTNTTAPSTSWNTLRLYPCGVARWNQMLELDAAAATLRSTHLSLCVSAARDDVSATDAHTKAARMQRCKVHNPQQRLQFRRSDSEEEEEKNGSDAVATARMPSNTNRIDSSGSDSAFVVRSVGKRSLCMETSETTNAGFAVQVARCSATSGGQRFVYNATMRWIQSAVRPELCLDANNNAWRDEESEDDSDASDRSSRQRHARFARCSVSRTNQQFVVDALARTVRSAAHPLLCLDDGGGYFPGASTFRMAPCDLAAGNQQFAFVPRSALLVVPSAALLAPSITRSRTFVIESVYKSMCVDARFRLELCDDRGATTTTQRFQYNSATQAIEMTATVVGIATATPLLLCWTHSDASSSTVRVAFLSLERCVAGSNNQRFVFDDATNAFQIGTGLCLDDGGGWFAGETSLALLACDAHSLRQRFQLRVVV